MARKMSFTVLTVGDLRDAIEDLEDGVLVCITDGETVQQVMSFYEDETTVDSDEENVENALILSTKLEFSEEEE
jgi:hypothetical protein